MTENRKNISITSIANKLVKIKDDEKGVTKIHLKEKVFPKLNGVHFAPSSAVISKEGLMYVTKPFCCYGPIEVTRIGYNLEEFENNFEKEKFEIGNVLMPNLNPFTVIPAYTDSRKTNFGADDGRSVITAGYGCAGSGIRLMDTYFPGSIDIIPSKDSEFHKNMKDHNTLRLKTENGRIYLDFFKDGFLDKETNEELNFGNILTFQEANKKSNSIKFPKDRIRTDITDLLYSKGVDIDKTLELNEDLVEIRRDYQY